MLEELKELRQLRTQAVELTRMQEDLHELVQATPEYQQFLDVHVKLTIIKDIAAELEDKIREEAVELSRQSGFEQKKFGLVSVKEFTKVVVNDMPTAILWSAQNAPNCLSLTKDFDKVAKALPLSFVTIEKEYKGAIASDLSDLDKES